MMKENYLADLKPENYFRVANGTVVKSILDLDDSLEAMSDETFRCHVNDYRNDFSEWIRTTIKDEKLALDLLQTKDRVKTQLMVLRRLCEIFSKNA